MNHPAVNPRDWATRGPLERHPLATELPLEIRHLCPECAGRGGLCACCYGVGNVDTERLEQHNRQLWAATTEQQRVDRVIMAEPI
jgi:hypothetical protein